ncbi:uncharacterized protein LOC111092073 isoform X1 [Canis lupus familiaris]|uniref:uncharacterized protein LOC111092073 isoform X1 n=1 Tax=Canis lupus familiaris TaxID=9615 RepID=UPI000BAA2A6A|nr:uncharacterized protein LOC111092073 isoform X1 [Canis lupus familiaris]|eukprot:XP_022264746.1 uncharacterized protein LOC111092073 [Canis lupus familiaris]
MAAEDKEAAEWSDQQGNQGERLRAWRQLQGLVLKFAPLPCWKSAGPLRSCAPVCAETRTPQTGSDCDSYAARFHTSCNASLLPSRLPPSQEERDMSGARQIATKLFLLAEMHLFLLNKHFMDCWKPWVHLFKLCRSLDIARSFYTSALSSSYLCAIVTEVARRTASVASTTAGGSVWSPGSAWTEFMIMNHFHLHISTSR